MSSLWDTAKELAEREQIGGIFVKLENDGDKIVGVFLGDPHVTDLHWIDNQSVPCCPPNCTHCSGNVRKSSRFSLNFYVPEKDELKIIQGGSMWFKDVLKVKEKYGLDKWTFEVERHGSKGDKKTTYSILPEKQIDERMQKIIDVLPLFNLADKCNSTHDTRVDNGYKSVITIAEQEELVNILKQKSKDIQVNFGKRFGRVNCLTVDKFNDAKKWIDLEGDELPF